MIEISHVAKLLGINMTHKFDWALRINIICKKASKRLYYLRNLKRSGLSEKELVQVYLSMKRPVAEYACQVWATSLTQASSDELEAIQKRAFKIIAPSLKYIQALDRFGLPSLKVRRITLCTEMFKDIMNNPDHRLHSLLPKPKQESNNLRGHKKYPLPRIQTNRSKHCLINWGLYNAQ